MAAILKNGLHLKFQVASAFCFQKVTPKGSLRQVWCLYHILKDLPGEKNIYLLHYSRRRADRACGVQTAT